MTKLKSLHMLLLTRYAASKYSEESILIEIAKDERTCENTIISDIALVRRYFQTKRKKP